MGNNSSKNKCCNICLFAKEELPHNQEIKIYNSLTNKDITKGLIDRHIIGTKTTIQDKCLNCNGVIALTWNNTPQFIHQGEISCSCSIFSESALYKLAVKYTKNYLKRGGKIIFNTECMKCRVIFKNSISEPVVEIREKVILEDKYVLDIGVYNFNDELIFGIQVYNLEKSIFPKNISDINIFEVLSVDPIYKLVNVTQKPIELKNYQSNSLCPKCKNKEITKLTI
jgi:hypothetical protein